MKHANRSGREPEQRRVLFVTYTMSQPLVGGVFFRALRLALEFHRRGYEAVICNSGPELSDPKVQEAQGKVRFVRLLRDAPGFNVLAAYRLFEALDPSTIIFGEMPFELMKVFYQGAKLVRCPFVLLDQYYSDYLFRSSKDVDLVLLWGLKCPGQTNLDLPNHHYLMPPMVGEITPKSKLPVPARLHQLPWITIIAYDSTVLERSISLLSGLPRQRVAIVTASRDPVEAARLMSQYGMASKEAAHLELTTDADVHGLMNASRVTLVSNGFLQIIDALALACPVICISRGNAAITATNVAECLRPYVSIDEPAERQRERVLEWLEASPFSPELRSALQSERGSLRKCVDMIERLDRARWTVPRIRREIQRALFMLRHRQLAWL
ncbi:MAG: hypothetical protein M3441_01585 [Chloroflexota bacterium]|nr:hypothetical protein [Chloroflexota bacterium]